MRIKVAEFTVYNLDNLNLLVKVAENIYFADLYFNNELKAVDKRY